MTDESLAMLIFGAGGIQFGEFTLKMHEKHPDAPKSPIYINLRGKPKGPLPQEILRAIGRNLFSYIHASSYYQSFDHIVGLPKAGEPIAEGFHDALGLYKLQVSRLQLEKEETETGRQILPIIHGEYKPGDRVLMIDDMITAADTKLEGAKALRDNYLVVEHCLVLVDREQGGEVQLAEHGIRLHAVFTLTRLLDLYSREGLITWQMRQDVIDYRQRVEEYLATHQPT